MIKALSLVLVLLLIGCWNKPFETTAWRTGNEAVRCAMAADLEKRANGMNRAELEDVLGIEIDGAKHVEEIGVCLSGCQGGGYILLQFNFDGNVVTSTERLRG